MSSSNKDKQRLEKKAQKYVIKGQLDKAIQEYKLMFDADPKDKRILRKLAELQERTGDRPGAVQSWMRVAKSYSRGEYCQQAVSIYKHVLQLVPDKIDARLRLAEEYAKLGFTLDAIEQFLESATQMERIGRSGEMVSIYKRLVELQPQNVDYRLRLAQLLAKSGQTSSAAELLSQTALDLAQARRIQEFIFWGERALHLEALNVELLNALARVYLNQGNSEQAMGKLEPALRADPYNIETLWLLASVFHADGQGGKVRLIHQRLSELCAQQGNPPGLRATVERVTRMLPVARPEPKQARKPVADLTEKDEIPEIGSAEFFMLEEKAGAKIQISPEFLSDIPEIPPEEFVIIR